MVHWDIFGEQYKLVHRISILRMQSLLQFLLSAPLFNTMIQYSWVTTGLKNEDQPFHNAFTGCFKFELSICAKFGCPSTIFIKCSWCREEICFQHFYDDYHVMTCSAGLYSN